MGDIKREFSGRIIGIDPKPKVTRVDNPRLLEPSEHGLCSILLAQKVGGSVPLNVNLDLSPVYLGRQVTITYETVIDNDESKFLTHTLSFENGWEQHTSKTHYAKK